MKNIALLSFLSIMLLACAKPQMLQYKGFQLKGLQSTPGSTMQLTGDVSVFNPNKFSVKIWHMESTCYVNNKAAGTLVLDSLIELPSSGTVALPINANLHFNEILSNGLSLLLGGDIPYSIKGTAKAGKGKFRWNLPFHHNGTFTRKDLQSLF